MKLNFDRILQIIVLIALLVMVIGPQKILYNAFKIYNGSEVNKKDYSIKLPDNWAVRSASSYPSTRIFGFEFDGTEKNTFLIDLYEVNMVPKSFISKWSKCDNKAWYPITTYEGKKLAISLCTFDFNTTTDQKPSLMLNDENGSVIASAYDWKPYYHEQYLKVFKSIKINEGSSIVEVQRK